MRIRSPAVAPALLLALAAVACGDAERDAPDAGAAADTTATPAATAVVRDSAGRELGTLTLISADSGIAVQGSLGGLPMGEYAIHLHNVGSCEPPAFESAGDHWNPTNARHGSHAQGGPHLGDLRNITSMQDSVAAVRVMTAGGHLREEPALLDADGAAVVVHAQGDDYETQPSGNAGPPIACGVVEE
jgi:Cu-Zn family superoxide dismutase